MRFEHKYQGEGTCCALCGGSPKQHRAPRKRSTDRSKYDDGRARSGKRRAPKPPRPIVGIDGEGHDTPDGRHIYTYLAAVNEKGRLVAEARNPEGLSTAECCEFLLAIPRGSRVFVFSGGYDWSLMIRDLPLTSIWFIMHPEARTEREDNRTVRRALRVSVTRKGKKLPRRYRLDWFNGSFSCAVGSRKTKTLRSTKVWDCFRFFQESFVNALERWNIGTEEQRKAIRAMKDQRGEFANLDAASIEAYCREECHLLAQMMAAVLAACERAGIRLDRYEGAGSIASALMKKHGVKERIGPSLEDLDVDTPGIQHAIMSAYFGGRFEGSCVGHVTTPVYARDIYSAYPYALSGLPCLACGNWKKVTHKVLERARQGTLAVVRYRTKALSTTERRAMAWAPLPCRMPEGSITYGMGHEGWAWLSEIEAALAGWSGQVEVLEAYVYTTKCEHKPWAWIPDVYRKRFEWGKDGAGIVLKLGLNACAGKTMQSKGEAPPFKSWIWGGALTAQTRAQALEAICAVKNRWDVYAVATDGVFMNTKKRLAKPRDTGTGDLAKPLGGWGCEAYETGVFFVKPGMYFDDALELLKARGVGKRALKATAAKLTRAFRRWSRLRKLTVKVKDRRFHGARSSIIMWSLCATCDEHWPGIGPCPSCGEPGALEPIEIGGKNPVYCKWTETEIKIEFEWSSKRGRAFHEDKRKSYARLEVKDLRGVVSEPYAGHTTPQGFASRLAQVEAEEQPEWSDD